LYVRHYGMSLAVKRVDAHLSSGWTSLTVRELPGNFRGDVRRGFLVGSEAHGATPCLLGLFDAAAEGLADWSEFDSKEETESKFWARLVITLWSAFS
jgi:hypothetical protein